MYNSNTTQKTNMKTSKTLHIDLQGTKAWARLAEAQHPPPTPRDDNEARSHVQRRWLAKALPHPRRALEGVTLPRSVWSGTSKGEPGWVKPKTDGLLPS